MELAIALVGGLLALDSASAGQFSLSRPLAAGAITGWLLGEPMAGVAVGAILEIFALAALPSGGAQMPDTAAGTIAAVATAAAGSGVGALALGVAFGLVWGRLGEASVQWMRRGNGRGAARLLARPERVSPEELERTHLSALAVDFLRGAALAAAGALVGGGLARRAAEAWPLAPEHTLALILGAGAVSLGMLASDLFAEKRARLLLAAGAGAAALFQVVVR